MSNQIGSSVVRAIKASLYDRLVAQPEFIKVPGLVVIPKDMFSSISRGLLPVQSGIAFFVEAFSADKANSDTPGPYYEGGRITVSVVEDPILNDPTTNANAPGLNCDEVAELAQTYLHLFFPNDGAGACTVSTPSEVENDTLSIRRFYVNLPVGYKPVVLPDMPAIVLSQNGGAGVYPLTVTMSLAQLTPGAVIFYTLDGTFPSPRNPSARAYLPASSQQLQSDGGSGLVSDGGVILITDQVLSTTPLVLTGPATLKARAYLASYNSGQETTAVFN